MFLFMFNVKKDRFTFIYVLYYLASCAICDDFTHTNAPLCSPPGSKTGIIL